MCNGNCEQCNNHKDEAPNPGRRRFLGGLVAAINLALVGAVVGPVMGFVGSPLASKRNGKWLPILDESELPVGKTREVSFTARVKDGYMTVDRKYTVFVKRSEDELLCFDPACTHLGCKIELQEEKGRYLCPCHGGVFDAEGKVVSGPPPKGLDQHPVKLEAGKIWIFKEV